MNRTKTLKFLHENKKSFQHFSKMFIKHHKKIKKCVDVEGQIPKDFDETMENESFHSAIGPALFLPQTFLVFPIHGALDKDYRKIEFILISTKTFLALFFIIFSVITSVLINYFYIKLGITLDSVGTMMFYNLVTLSSIILFLLARKWKQFIDYWTKHELVFLSSPYTIKGQKLSTKIRFVVFSMFIFCVCEHLMSQASYFDSNQIQISYCGLTNVTLWQWMSQRSDAYLFTLIPYNMVLSIPPRIFPILGTLALNYIDLMIMFVSIGLSTRFNQFNDRLDLVKGLVRSIEIIFVFTDYYFICRGCLVIFGLKYEHTMEH